MKLCRFESSYRFRLEYGGDGHTFDYADTLDDSLDIILQDYKSDEFAQMLRPCVYVVVDTKLKQRYRFELYADGILL